MAEGRYFGPRDFPLVSLLEEVEWRRYGELCRGVRESLRLSRGSSTGSGPRAKSAGGFREGVSCAWGYPYKDPTTSFHDPAGLSVRPIAVGHGPRS